MRPRPPIGTVHRGQLDRGQGGGVAYDVRVTEWGNPGEQPSAGYSGPPPTNPYAAPPSYPIGAPYPPAPYGYGYGYPPPYYAIGPSRPGTTIASAVLGYINAGLLVLAGSLLLFGASVISDIEEAADSHTDYGAELAFDGLLNFVAAGLLIAGGVMFTGRNATGRVLFSVAGGIVLAETVYWLVRFDGVTGSGVVVYPTLFAALTIIGLALVWTNDVSRWLSGR